MKLYLPVRNTYKIEVNAKKREGIYLITSIQAHRLWLGEQHFKFLNIEHNFKEKINWNYSSYGKLWTYNLNYFEFLNQGDITKEAGLSLIHSFIKDERIIKDGLEPFPISLRLFFWIKFLIQKNVKDSSIDESMHRQLYKLSAMPEYHLMGNHLLENGFSLLFGAIYFTDKHIYQQAEKIITEQLKEQILADGGHFELSPMYHQILLYRILDCINLLQHSTTVSTKNILKVLNDNASLMLGWMKKMTFSNGDMPRLNDSTIGICPNSQMLQDYAKRLDVPISNTDLKESGYRKIKNDIYEVIVDIGQIGPDYIPGHAHSDTFNFVLYHKENPLIVDTGISTYEKNERRQLERSTESHNTVQIANKEQSEIWGGFRVAKRATVTIIEDSINKFVAQHNGYQKVGCIHQRLFLGEKQSFIIEDTIIGDQEGTAYIHFYPSIKVQHIDNTLQGDSWQIQFEAYNNILLENYLYAEGYNQTVEAIRVKISFSNKLTTTITFT